MNFKNTILGFGIFGAGVGVGFLVCKKLLVEQYKDDLEEVKNFYYNKIEEMGVMDNDFEPSDLDDEIFEYIGDPPEEEDEEEESWEESQERDDREYLERVMKYSKGVRNENGNANTKGTPIIQDKPPLDIGEYGDIEDEFEDEEVPDYEAELEARAEEYAERRYRNQQSETPFPIESDEFEDGPDEYDRRYLYYYTGDRVLCEEDDSIVDDIEDLVGLDYEDILDMQTTAWVRNDKIRALFEIYRINDHYKVAVQGILETPKERDFRIRGRRKQANDDRE